MTAATDRAQPVAPVLPDVVDAYVADCAAVQDNLLRLSARRGDGPAVVIPARTVELLDGMSSYGD